MRRLLCGIEHAIRSGADSDPKRAEVYLDTSSSRGCVPRAVERIAAVATGGDPRFMAARPWSGRGRPSVSIGSEIEEKALPAGW
ncbi:hypothetical protein [Streptomyces sp. DASNCL29]|uniref:hypothetical protein n=1 Tax=Streptomyces TaxID=1883 RepID=UPI001F0FBB49|nr:hypothetical protein [Streptomyces sp. DASNCL29]